MKKVIHSFSDGTGDDEEASPRPGIIVRFEIILSSVKHEEWEGYECTEAMTVSGAGESVGSQQRFQEVRVSNHLDRGQH